MTPQLNAWIYTIGWALIHFVWQGGLIALATAAALRFVSPPLVGDALRDCVCRAGGDARRAGHYGCSRLDIGPDDHAGRERLASGVDVRKSFAGVPDSPSPDTRRCRWPRRRRERPQRSSAGSRSSCGRG